MTRPRRAPREHAAQEGDELNFAPLRLGGLALDAQFEWQEGYSVFAVSASMIEAVRQYIAAQEEHHRQRTFEKELRELLEKHGVQYDPKYLL